MFSTLRNRFGIPGVISVIALVFALVGGAFAANDLGGSGSGATASAKKKAVKGPRGPRGATGPAGPAGAAGPAGPKGDTGAAGANGSNGADGAKGATGPTGLQGIKGATGATGPTGSTGQTGFTKTLPSGESLYGTWGLGALPGANNLGLASISFSIPLEEAPFAYRIPASGPESPEQEEACPGTVEEPAAAPGALCVYVVADLGTFSAFEPVTPGGAVLIYNDAGFGYGTWAVTAE